MKQLLLLTLLLASLFIAKAQDSGNSDYVKAGVQIFTPIPDYFYVHPYIVIQHSFSDKNLIEYGLSNIRFDRTPDFSSRFIRTTHESTFRLQYNRILLSKWGAAIYAGGAADVFYEYVGSRSLVPTYYTNRFRSLGIRPYTGLGLMWRTPGRWMFEVFVPLLVAEVSVDRNVNENPNLPERQQKTTFTNLDAAFGYGIRLGTGVRLTK